MRVSGGTPVWVVSPGETQHVDVHPALVGNIGHQASLASGVGATIWTPAAGEAPHISTVHVSATGAGVVTISVGGVVEFTFEFPQQGSANAGLSVDLEGNVDELVTALAVMVNPANTAFVNVIGHEAC